MREIYLKYSDHELFDTMFAPEHCNFIVTHMDAFKSMWNEQNKAFWCKHLTMYRHHCYNFGTVQCLHNDNLNPVNMSLEYLTILADQIFIVLYDEFVNCRYGTAKDFIRDLTSFLSNRGVVLACRNSSIRNNPFYVPETRDVFRKLLGCCRNYPPGMKEFYTLYLAYPIYGIFGGSIYHVLKRWLHAYDISAPEDVYLQKCWQCPPELQGSSFVPQPYHRHLLERSGDQVDHLLKDGCFGLFSSNRISPAEGYYDSREIESGGRVPFGSHKIFETFIEFISSRQLYPTDKFDAKDLNSDFGEYLKEKVDDFEEEEFRRSLILKLAERRFQEEQQEENKHQNKGEKNKKTKTSVQENSISEKDNVKNCASNSNHKTSSVNELAILPSSQSNASSNSSKQPSRIENAVSNKDVESSASQASIPSSKVTSSSSNVTQKPAHSAEASSNTKKNAVDMRNEQCQTPLSFYPPNNECSPGKNSKKKQKGKKMVELVDIKIVTNSDQTKTVSSVTEVSIKKGKNSKKNGSKKINPTTKQDNLVKPKSNTDGKVNIGGLESTSSSSQKAGTACSQGSTTELGKIKKNIDTIQKSVQEQNGLSLDGFRLMVETGSLLMSNNKKGNSSETTLQNCSQCGKTEEKPKCFKKCARCKTENVKFVRYYCNRDCQAENWITCHQEEHEKGMLVKNN